MQRRYSDFTWLKDALLNRFLGCVVPPLPAEGAKNRAVGLIAKAGHARAEKAVGSNTVSAFFSRRQGGMQLFLSRVAAHGELAESEIFTKFLQEFSLDAFKKELKEAENQRRVSPSQLWHPSQRDK